MLYKKNDIDTNITVDRDYIIKNEESSTTGSYLNNIQGTYDPVLPKGVDVFRDVQEELFSFTNEGIKLKAQNFFNIFKNISYNFFHDCNNNESFSKLALSILEDCVIIEWNFNNIRIGFVFDDEHDGCIYYVVESDCNNKSNSAQSGILTENQYGVFIEELLKFIIGKI